MTKPVLHYLLLIPEILFIVGGVAILFACLASYFGGSPNMPDYRGEPLGWRKVRSDLESSMLAVARYWRQRREWREDSMDAFEGNPINLRLLLTGIGLLALGVALAWWNGSV